MKIEDVRTGGDDGLRSLLELNTGDVVEHEDGSGQAMCVLINSARRAVWLANGYVSQVEPSKKTWKPIKAKLVIED